MTQFVHRHKVPYVPVDTKNCNLILHLFYVFISYFHAILVFFCLLISLVMLLIEEIGVGSLECQCAKCHTFFSNNSSVDISAI